MEKFKKYQSLTSDLDSEIEWNLKKLGDFIKDCQFPKDLKRFTLNNLLYKLEGTFDINEEDSTIHPFSNYKPENFLMCFVIDYYFENKHKEEDVLTKETASICYSFYSLLNDYN